MCAISFVARGALALHASVTVMRPLLVASLVIALAAAAPAAAADPPRPPQTFAPIADTVKAAVFSVVRPGGGEEEEDEEDWLDMRPPLGHGTLGAAVMIDPAGLALTSSRAVRERTLVELLGIDGRRYRATVAARDERSDIALLHVVTPLPLPVARLGNSDTVQIGDWVLAVGSPYGFDASVSAGIVSARARVSPGGPYRDLLQADVGANLGSAGGPLVNTRGEVVGLLTMAAPRGWGIAFAVPSNVVRRVADDLVAHGRVVRSWLGVTPQPLTPDLARALNAPLAGGLVLADVVAAGPAARAGLVRGTVVLALDDRALRTAQDLDEALDATTPGRTVTLTVWRTARRETVRVVLAMEPDPRQPAEWTREMLGLVVEAITPEGGLFVSRVRPGSPGALAGVIPGDVIREIASQTVWNATELERAARAVTPDAATLILVQRGRTPFYVVVPAAR
jgi:serine protease Do